MSGSLYEANTHRWTNRHPRDLAGHILKTRRSACFHDSSDLDQYQAICGGTTYLPINRPDGRSADDLRPVTITPGYLDHAEGSALIVQGSTRVLCAASIEDRIPGWLRGQQRGWVTAEYAMLPRATHTRTARARAQGRDVGRSQEIQRLIGRSLRAVTDLGALGERSITVDCDVIQADGGTRTAAITGAYVALYQALLWTQNEAAKAGQPDPFDTFPLTEAVAAVSVGILTDKEQSELLLDLCYEEDSEAGADFNIVATESGRLVEVQGTAEGSTYTRAQLDAVLDLANRGIADLLTAQQAAIATLT